MNDRFTAGARIVIGLLLAFYAAIMLKNAWVGDDAYITLRTVDNFVNGYGLTFNVVERVQAFTHPLWMLVLTAFYFFTREAYFTILFVSVSFSLAAVGFYAFKIAKTTAMAVLGILILSLSDAFVDYSTSGLENPLTYFILALFLYVYFSGEINLRRFLYLSFLAAMAVLNRMDMILLYLPMLIYAFWQVRGRRALIVLMVGFLPMIVWELFSLWYYGFLFPNTAYAKLNTGLGMSWMIPQGLHYLANTVRIDPLTAVVIAVGIIAPFALRRQKSAATAVGMILMLLYTIWIGGCFMSGRHLAAPLLAAVIVLSQLPVKWSKVYIVSALVAVLGLGLMPSRSPVYAKAADGGRDQAALGHSIIDERVWYNQTNALINYDADAEHWPSKHWVADGIKAGQEGRKVLAIESTGMCGYYAGPSVYILDIHALGDPLLARLPVRAELSYKPGHFRRHPPPGYAAALETGTNVIRDTSLAEYYDHLNIITRGGLFSLSRLWKIARFNFGSYDNLITEYIRPKLQIYNLAEIDTPSKRGIAWHHPDNFQVDSGGLEIQLGSYRFTKKLEIGRHFRDGYRFVFFRRGEEVGELVVPRARSAKAGLFYAIVDIPLTIYRSGYTAIRIYPEGKDPVVCLGHLRLVDRK